MSNALAIAAVTAVLKDLLNNGLIGHDLASAVGFGERQAEEDESPKLLPGQRIMKNGG